MKQNQDATHVGCDQDQSAQRRRSPHLDRMQGDAHVGSSGIGQIARRADCVRSFDDFHAGNDPYGEHDFGSMELFGEKLFWKFDYYDLALSFASPDPADPSVTVRVLTIMLANEY